MNKINLGIVFGPNIFRCSHDMEGLKLQSDMNNIMSCFISHFNQLFKDNIVTYQRDTINGSSYFCLDSPIITQTMSTEGQKSSPSLSGDFDLSSSNDNQMCPAPLPTSISSNLHQTISNCVNNRLSEDIDIPSSTLLDVPINNDYRMFRTSSMPHNISKYSNDINNEFTDISTKSSTEPTAQPRSNISLSGTTSNLKKTVHNQKNSTRKPLLVTQESWNDITDKKDYLTNKSGNKATVIDDMLPDWQCQNNLIDLDDFDGDVMMNDTKENSLHYKTDKSNTVDSSKKCETIRYANQKLNINEIKDRIKYLRKMLKGFEDNFERQHGCSPPNIEKTGNSQVQEWLTELVYLREQLTSWQSDNFEGTSVRGSHKLNIQSTNVKSAASLQSSASTFSGVSEQIGTAHKLKVISTLENVNAQNMSVVQYFEYITTAIENQRNRVNRPELLSDMTKEQMEEEKTDLQKCLLHFEKNYGRPRENNIKQMMKPLYDRYRLVKRLMKTSENEAKIPTTINNQANGEYGNSATPVSSRSRGHSLMKFSENIEIIGKSRKESFTGTVSHEGNDQMSHSFTTGNDGRSNYWKQSTSTGSWKSGAINISQESVNKHTISQNSNTTQRLLPAESLPHKHGPNLKLKSHSSSVPMPVDNQNSFTPVTYNTPIHSMHSTKSFNSSVEDIIPFRSCNTMSKIEIEAEKEVLQIEKRKLQKLLKDFEHEHEKITGRKIEKSGRDNMRAEYDRYKTIKCRLRMLEKELER